MYLLGNMSAADNTKVIGLAWPDDRQGSICSLTPLVLSTSAASSSTDLHTHIHRELIPSEIEVQMENPSVSTASDTSVKGSGLYRKNISKQATDCSKNKTASDVFSMLSETEARSSSGTATPEYYTGLPLVRTWSNPALYEGGYRVHGFSGPDLTNHGYKQLQGPCCDR